MIKNKLVVPGIAALGMVAGIVGTNIAANAEGTVTGSSDTSSKTMSKSAAGSKREGRGSKGAPAGPHQANGKTETELTGDQLAKAKAAAEAKVSGATVVRAETDADGDGTYEVHMQKSDGSQVTVFLDANFTVTSTHDGMGKGGPRDGRGQHRDSNGADDTTGTSTQQ